MDESAPLLSVEHLKVSYPIRSSILLRKIGEKLAVSDVNFEIRPGETVGLVGESGSGKSTIARTVIGLVPSAGGVIRFEGRDITGLSGREMKDVRRDMQMVFQDPYASLNPRLTVRDLIAEAWRVHPGIVSRERWTAEAKDLMAKGDPGSPAAIDLARRWSEMVKAFTQGDPALARRSARPAPRRVRRGRGRAPAGDLPGRPTRGLQGGLRRRRGGA